jgi:Ca-activated chloride channel family protein
MNAKRISAALTVSLVIHGIIMLVASIFYVTRAAQFKDLVRVQFVQSALPPVSPVRARVIKAVNNPALERNISVDSSLVSVSEEAASLHASVPHLSHLNPPNGEAYRDMYFKGSGTNPFIDTEDDHLSTFGMDVDTGSYSITRRYLTDGYLPPAEAIRVEEFINTFDYNYDPPTEDVFSINIDGAPSKFGEGKRLQLLRIGLRGRVIPSEHRKDANLTFVIDVSGSMEKENRLELVKKALTLLVDQLRPTDKVGIVVYGSRGKLVLPHTDLTQRREILTAINSLQPAGSTNAEEGLRIGYDLAWRNASVNHINRVILCSDGVANVGNTGPDAILKEIRTYVDKGITLSTVGFGMGNYNDVLMERLADTGNGSYAYVDTRSEAKRIFVENLTGTLQLIATDAKIQVDFNPDVVSRFRLLGYENRRLDHEEFRDDTVDAGEVGSGHQVTALYEVKLNPDAIGKLATVSIRYADPDNHRVSEVSEDISVSQLHESFDTAPATFRLAAAVAEFAEILRESYWAKDGSLDAVHQVVKDAFPEIDGEQVVELMYLVNKATSYKTEGS